MPALTRERIAFFVAKLEAGCEYRSEYPGNVGPACGRCSSCRKILAEYEREKRG